MAWWQRWNFIARARLEREVWDAFERGEDLEGRLEAIREEAGMDPGQRLRLDVWTTTLPRVRRIEGMMQGQTRRPEPPSDA
ncbi:hypothetical protein EVJ50_06940 [Synechococcus sp. RSCCF101]|uniref:hypothetical protein n=1 Tax=Synechococcus sp. RSCCF101 TaxID=2511069 RepID=UPI0012478D64|nr:hypothetical protein [Synechococcus sp. RSCCF101]QEY32014.1 hypothetical protein EVJ50_06940 [Synechococcus sp. RSCCF101]